MKKWDKMELNEKAYNKKWGKREGGIMFPTTHDITPETLEECITFLHKLLTPENSLLIVSKPHLECIKRICKEFTKYKENILFRFTIGSHQDDILKFWEPGAPDFEERFSCLKYAKANGYSTSVSCEPMLDNQIETLISAIRNYVTETIWIGKLNSATSRLKINGAEQIYLDKAKELLDQHSDERIWEIYNTYKNDSLIQWKDSIKAIVGLPYEGFGVEEWAKHSANCYSGCSHDCKYCYAKSMAIRFKRCEK